jgi:hypothetical protein
MSISQVFAAIRRYLAEAPDAIKNHLNTTELLRIAVAALTTGGGVFSVLQAIVVNAGTIFPAPADAALATAVFTVILEVNRRLNHGAEPPAPLPKRRGWR